MKILILSDVFPPYSTGGAERIAYLFAKQYLQEGHEVIAVSTVQEKQHEGKQIIEGYTTYTIYTCYPDRWRAYAGVYNPQTLPAVRKILMDEKPAVIHSHNVHCFLSYHCFKIAHDLRIPVVLTMHDAMSFDYGKFTQFINTNDLSQYPKVYYKINPWRTFKTYRFRYFPLRNFMVRYYLHRYVTKMVAVSNELKIALNANGIRCTEVVHNGIDLSRFHSDTAKVADFKKSHGIDNKKVILFSGRLSYLKGGEHILRALQHVSVTIKDAVLLVVGQTEGYAQRMKEIANAMGIHDRIVFTGWLSGDDLIAAYAASDVVVSPSICWDSFPTVNLEAMAMRKPVVAICFGGSKELVIDGVTGYIINPLNITMLAERISELLVDEEKTIKMGKAGYQRISEHFTIQQQTRKMLDILTSSQRII